MTFFGKLPKETGEIILKLIGSIFDLIRAGNDEAAQEEALMTIAEHTKEELDRRKFKNEGG